MRAEILTFPTRLQRARDRYDEVCRLPAGDPQNVTKYRDAMAELLEAQRLHFYQINPPTH